MVYYQTSQPHNQNHALVRFNLADYYGHVLLHVREVIRFVEPSVVKHRCKVNEREFHAAPHLLDDFSLRVLLFVFLCLDYCVQCVTARLHLLFKVLHACLKQFVRLHCLCDNLLACVRNLLETAIQHCSVFLRRISVTGVFVWCIVRQRLIDVCLQTVYAHRDVVHAERLPCRFCHERINCRRYVQYLRQFCFCCLYSLCCFLFSRCCHKITPINNFFLSTMCLLHIRCVRHSPHLRIR